MTKVAVICAMRKEYELLKSLESEFVSVGLCGIGKVNSALCTDRMIRDYSPDCLINIGVSGALEPSLSPGDLLLSETVQYHDVWCGEGCSIGQVQDMPLKYVADKALLSAAASVLPGARVGNLISGDQFYISAEEDSRQKRMFPDALAVDMESASVAQVCYCRGVPFLSLRIVSDIHDDRQSEHYSEFWDTLAAQAFEAAKLVVAAIAG